MPKKAKELSAVEVKRITKQGVHAVGGVAGLLLQVTSTAAHSWILRAKVGSKRRDMGLGGYPDVTLAGARDKAREMREKIQQGIDPVEERKAAREALKEDQRTRLIFDDAVVRYLTNKQHEFKNAKHFAQWGSTLKTYASPVVGNLPVSDINLNHIIQILEPIWLTKTETAKRLRGRIENVLSWATISGFRTGDNPARWKGYLDNVLPKPSKVTKVKHHPSLPAKHIYRFLSNLHKRDGAAAAALEFLILTATRSQDVRGATWSEVDLQECLWTIYEHRGKTGKEHRVPLTDGAIKFLKSLPRMAEDKYLFTAPRGGQLSDMSLSALVKRMHKADIEQGGDGYIDPKENRVAVPHGFRSTFRDWAAEDTNYPNIVVEMALAHSIGNKVEAAYRRGDLLEKRTWLMNDWIKYCNTEHKKGDVVFIREMNINNN